MRDCITRLEAIIKACHLAGITVLAANLQGIVQDMYAIQDGLDMGPDLGK